jgi:hypothetical protein
MKRRDSTPGMAFHFTVDFHLWIIYDIGIVRHSARRERK